MEFMANLQNGFDELKPSLFELLSEQQLTSLIPPSLRYILAVATHRYPRYLLRALNSFDELYALVMLLVERHYLYTYGGGFTENFYGLKRELVLRVKNGEVRRAQLGTGTLVRETLKLREVDVWKNLAVMVGLPYIKRKLDDAFDIYAPQATILGPTYRGHDSWDSASIRQRLLHHFEWFIRNAYPFTNAAYYFSLLAFHLAYLFDASKYHSPFLWLLGVRMRRMGQPDHRAIALAAERRPYTNQASTRARISLSSLNPRSLGSRVHLRMLSSLRILLPTSIFALKFLEWWHASDFARQLSRKAAEAVELPPPVVAGLSDHDAFRSEDQTPYTPRATPRVSKPPRAPVSSKSSLPIFTVPAPTAATNSLCPICLTQIATPTACQTGYVFCYTCIFRWVSGTHARQIAFMEGGGGEAGWEKEEGSREGKWESGEGRCAVTARRILGGTDGLRIVIV